MADERFLIWLRPVYPAGVNLIPVMAGLLTRPGHRAFPVLHQWQKFDVRFLWTHSSGYCSGFSPDSLFILSGIETVKEPSWNPKVYILYFKSKQFKLFLINPFEQTCLPLFCVFLFINSFCSLPFCPLSQKASRKASWLIGIEGFHPVLFQNPDDVVLFI